MFKENNMKNNWRIPILSILVLAGLLAGCTGVPTGTNWPGLAASTDAAYLSNSSNVYAVQLNNGTMLWKYPEENARIMFFAPAALDGNQQVIVGDYTKTLYSINPKNGSTNWRFTQAASRFIGAALVTSDTIYAPNADFSLYALDLTGGLKWKYTTGQAVWAQPVTDGEVVYFNSLDHFTYALKADDGSLVWKTDLKGPSVSAPVLTDGILYVGMLDKGLVALEKATGTILWETPTEDGIYGTPVQIDGKIIFGDLSGNIYSLDAETGTSDWKIKPGGVIASSPARFESGVVFTTEIGEVIAVDPSGTILWNKQITGQLNASPVVGNTLILVASFQGDNLLTAFDFDGNQKWTFNPPKK
jgi:outer membrane protein assembly factor BamB